MIRISLATVDDAAVLHRLMLAAFDEYRTVLNPPSSAHRETVADVARALDHGGGLLAWIDGEVAGCARYQLRPARLYVGRVAVLPQYRRRGVALALMTEMERVARDNDREEIEVGVRMSLPTNINLYRRLGYDLVDVQPHPRGPDRTGTMVKRLGSLANQHRNEPTPAENM